MVYVATAGCIITSKKEVLLRQTIDEQTKIVCHEPVKGGVSSTDFVPSACHQILREALNKVLSRDYQRYLLVRLAISDPENADKKIKEREEPFTFGDKDELKGIRWHFFYAIKPEWIIDFLLSPEFRLLKKEEWEKVRKFTEAKRRPPRNPEQVTVLYDFDYDLLINRIWEIQKVLAPMW